MSSDTPIEVFVTLNASNLDISVSARRLLSTGETVPIDIISRIKTILPEELALSNASTNDVLTTITSDDPCGPTCHLASNESCNDDSERPRKRQRREETSVFQPHEAVCSATHVGQCRHVSYPGTSYEQKCKHKIPIDDDFCRQHERYHDGKRGHCDHILVKGKNRGKQCNRPCDNTMGLCNRHLISHEQSAAISIGKDEIE